MPLSRTTRLILAGLLVGALAWVAWRWDLAERFSPANVAALLESAGWLAPAIFMAVMALAVVVSPIPSLPLDVLAGTVFGPFWGTLWAALGASLGAVASFAISRLVGRDILARYLKGHINFCRDCSDALLTKVVFLSRLIPFVSFDLVSYGAGLTKMSIGRFAVSTFVGTLPLTAIYVAFGASLTANRWVAVGGGVVMVALFFLLPRWIEKRDLFGLRERFRHGRDRQRTRRAVAAKRIPPSDRMSS